MTAIFLLVLLLILVSVGISLGRVLSIQGIDNTSPVGIFLGIALSPFIITIFSALILYINILPSALGWVSMIGPTALSCVLILCFHSRKIDTSFANFPWIWRLPLFLFLPFLAALIVQSILHSAAHDISIYLHEASSLIRHLKEGGDMQTYLDKNNYTHPHSYSYSIYLAWAFSTLDSPGFMADTMPKFLVGLNHLAALCAAVALVVMQAGRQQAHKYLFIWSIIGAAIILLHDTWAYQIRALSRDTYMLAPYLAFIALLLIAKPVEKIGWGRLTFLSITTLALWGGLLGHSLGVIYVGAASLAIGLCHCLRYSWRVFHVPELWVAASTLSIYSILIVYKYLSGAAELGFAYPFYTDPVLLKNLKANTTFLDTISIKDFFFSVFLGQGVHVWIFFPFIICGLLILYKLHKRKKCSELEIQWLYLLSILAVTITIILSLPFSLDGILLRNAFVSNFRYGFGLGVLALATVALSLRILYEHKAWVMQYLPYKGRKGLIKYAPFVSVFIISVLLLGTTPHFINHLSFEQSRDVAALSAYCQRKLAEGARKIMFDDDGNLYRCPHQSAYLFTQTGSQILSARSDKKLQSVIDGQNIDLFILKRSIDKWWKGTYLYNYLEENWQKSYQGSMLVFSRP